MMKLHIAKIGDDTLIPDHWIVVTAKWRRGWRSTPYWEIIYLELEVE